MEGRSVAILGAPDGWHARMLAQAVSRAGHHPHLLEFPSLVGSCAGEQSSLTAGSTNLFNVDHIIVRSVPAGSLEQVIVRVDSLHRLESAGLPVLNPPRAIEACVDKYLALDRIERAGLAIPKTFVCETCRAGLEAFQMLGGKAILKPIFGAEGRGMMMLDHPELAYRSLRTLEQLSSIIFLQEYIETDGYDLRAFILGDRVVAAMRRWQRAGDFRSNVTQGGRAEAVQLTPTEEQWALRAARAVGAPMAGVDLLPAKDGRLLVVEVNSAPGFRALSQATGVDVAGEIVRFALDGR